MRYPSKYDTLTYSELLEAVGDIDMTPKEARQAHRALRKYGDGLALHYRYPVLAPILYACGIVLIPVLMLAFTEIVLLLI